LQDTAAHFGREVTFEKARAMIHATKGPHMSRHWDFAAPAINCDNDARQMLLDRFEAESRLTGLRAMPPDAIRRHVSRWFFYGVFAAGIILSLSIGRLI
jgi:hypothetical protein